jgi:hypothetical protein
MQDTRKPFRITGLLRGLSAELPTPSSGQRRMGATAGFKSPAVRARGSSSDAGKGGGET